MVHKIRMGDTFIIKVITYILKNRKKNILDESEDEENGGWEKMKKMKGERRWRRWRVREDEEDGGWEKKANWSSTDLRHSLKHKYSHDHRKKSTLTGCAKEIRTKSIDQKTKPKIKSGLILKQAREPDALYFAIRLSCFAGCEPGRLFQIRLDIMLTSCIHAESLLDLLVIL